MDDTNQIPNDGEQRAPYWKGVKDERALFVLRQGELFLEAQLKISIAADQWAMVTASVLTGFAAGLLVSSLNSFAQPDRVAVALASLEISCLLFLGAWCCLTAARPVPFGHSGSEPKVWSNVLKNDDFPAAILGEAENYQDRITENEKMLRRNARWLRAGTYVAAAAPVVAFATFSLYSLVSSGLMQRPWW
jgi:hypothetical protein